MGQLLREVTPYFILLIFLTTLGPLQFGFHLVSSAATQKSGVSGPL